MSCKRTTRLRVGIYQQVITGNATAKSLQGLLSVAQGQLDAANTTIQSLQQQVNSSNATARSLQSQLTAANSVIETLQGQITAANATVQDLLDDMTAANVAANATIRSLLQQLGEVSASANFTIQTQQQQIEDANARMGHLNDIINNLSRIAPTPDNVIWTDFDTLYDLARTNEVRLNYYYRYRLVRMGQLKVVKVYDTEENTGVKIDLTSPGDVNFTLVFKSQYGLEKLAPDMTIIVYGTCEGSQGGVLSFGPDFTLVQIDSIP